MFFDGGDGAGLHLEFGQVLFVDDLQSGLGRQQLVEVGHTLGNDPSFFLQGGVGRCQSLFDSAFRQEKLDDVRPIHLFAETLGGIVAGLLVDAVIDLPAHEPFTVGGGRVVAFLGPDDPVVALDIQRQRSACPRSRSQIFSV